MNQGYIKLYRNIQDSRWYQDSNASRLYIHLLLNANHCDGYWKGIEVKRGQHITSRNILSEKLDISEQSIRTALNRLKSSNAITIKTTNKYTLITVVNYDIDQQPNERLNQEINQVPNQQVTSNQPASNHKQE